MLASLGSGVSAYPANGSAPEGSSSPFLSVGSPSTAVGAPDVGTLMRLGAGIHYVPGTSIPAPLRRPVRAAMAVGGLAAAVDRFNLSHIAEGKFTEETVRNMHRAVLAAKTDAKWRKLMEDVRREGRKAGAIGWKDYLGELAWLENWFRQRIDYVRDPYQVELVQHPWITLQKGTGDCDDMSAAICAGAGTLGAAHKFRTYKGNPRIPNQWTHVTGQIEVPGHGWVNSDLTLVGVPFGHEPTGYVTKDWPEPRY